ncbi:DMT family transporter [Ferrimonas kyonanensis]|uniref:DMT family transporter n=1 Tax=Ferrimonas kyonanensis TaxID=364763 RepID=UPI0004856CB7|nr:DMT family transporter [Ferrimonas kyonanensis]
MRYLMLVTLLWAFSFSLIGEFLAGRVDPWFSVLVRIALALMVMLPWLRPRRLSLSSSLVLMAIGACQLGVMYGFYYHSFEYLSVAEVLLFTVMTPVYVTLWYDLLHGRFSPWYLLTAAIAVAGTAVIKYASVNADFLLGFAVVQGANLCFAIGQASYKWWMEKQSQTLPQHQVFALFYVGALLVALPAYLMLGNSDRLPQTMTQWGILLWLGVVASGLGYFLWNRGACQVDAGALAIMNNLLVPAGLLVNLVLWQHNLQWGRLMVGGGLILGSLWLNEAWVKPRVEAARAMALARSAGQG